MNAIPFGKLIGKLLSYTGTKNYTLALELGYDVSYISKMINSKIYPSHKNASTICHRIASFVAKEATDSMMYAICQYLHIDINQYDASMQREEFAREIESILFESYTYSTEKPMEQTFAGSEKENLEASNSYTLMNPHLRRKFLRIPIDETVSEDNPLEIVILMNLFEMSRDDKLHIAGVKKDEMDKIKPEVMRFKMMLSITDSKNIDYLFDPILFIYMISNYCCDTFGLYATNFPFYSIAMSAKKHFAHFGIPGRDSKLLMATTSSDEKVIQDTYDTLDELVATSCHLVFEDYTSEEMILSKQYMRSIIGKNIRVLIGTMNELFMPSHLLLKIAKEVFGDNEDVYEELKNIDVVLNNATYNTDMHVMIYEQTLNNYVLTGEMNFFNKRIKLSIQDRKEHIKHMISIFDSHPNIKVKMIKGYFVEEFKQYDNPSVYLSTLTNYIPIQSIHTDRNMLVIKDQDVKKLFNNFYHEAWEKRKDIVSDNAIISAIEFSLNYMELLGR